MKPLSEMNLCTRKNRLLNFASHPDQFESESGRQNPGRIRLGGGLRVLWFGAHLRAVPSKTGDESSKPKPL